MSKFKKLAVAFVVTSVMSVSNSYGQCQSGCGMIGDQPCFGTGLFAFGNGELQAKWTDFQHRFQLVTDRNQAWPQPFICQDRAAYLDIWQVQYQHGLVAAHTLTSDCFNQYNELNQAGQSRVAWIMQNAPKNDKVIYVYDENDMTDARMASIRDTVNKWYGQMGTATIAKTTQKPNEISSVYQQTTNQLYLQGQPQPVIPVQVGSSIAGSATQ